jgi:hypothetical protein
VGRKAQLLSFKMSPQYNTPSLLFPGTPLTCSLTDLDPGQVHCQPHPLQGAVTAEVQDDLHKYSVTVSYNCMVATCLRRTFCARVCNGRAVST